MRTFYRRNVATTQRSKYTVPGIRGLVDNISVTSSHIRSVPPVTQWTHHFTPSPRLLLDERYRWIVLRITSPPHPASTTRRLGESLR
ncbi:hypothetical protein J6590_051584 [Homalodisca vitripennis]|nr:hypothetical protein J6590_051584 [Homalodisca vitripennis]